MSVADFNSWTNGYQFSLFPTSTGDLLLPRIFLFSFSVSGFTTRSLIHLGEGPGDRCVFSFILLHVDTQFSKHHLLNTFVSPVSYFDIPVKYQMAIVISMQAWALHFVPLDYMSASVLKPCCFYYCDSVIYPELWNNTSPSFVLFALSVWWFHMKLRTFFYFSKEWDRGFNWDCILYSALQENGHLYNISSTNPWTRGIFPYSSVFLNDFLQRFSFHCRVLSPPWLCLLVIRMRTHTYSRQTDRETDRQMECFHDISQCACCWYRKRLRIFLSWFCILPLSLNCWLSQRK